MELIYWRFFFGEYDLDDIWVRIVLEKKLVILMFYVFFYFNFFSKIRKRSLNW